jgi:4-hydroxy-tetrahydrodipicolinate reductase
MAIRVGVLGAAGRMGSTVCAAVEGDADLDLVARVDIDDPIQSLVDNGAEVAVDFTTADAARKNVLFCLDNSIHAVVGTTGLSESDLETIRKRAETSSANAFIAPNFAVGAVLMMRFAAAAARYFRNVEIIERHHENKIDAPSGTALRTAQLMNEQRSEPWDPIEPSKESLSGSRGGEEGGVHIHSIRVPGSVAHQEVILGSAGETLTIRHDSLDRSSFMPGVLLAVKKIGELEGLTVGLDALLDA